ETEANNGITRLAAKTLLKGTKTRSAEQIADQLEAVGGEITAQAGNNSFAVNLDITQPDLALGTDILADVLLNATMPATAVAREKEIQLAKIKDEEEKPTSVARNLIKRALFPGHPLALRTEGTPESVSRAGFRGADVFSSDRYALELIDEASSDLGSPLFIRIREQMGLAYYVGAAQIQALVPGLFAFYLGTDPEKIEPVKQAFLDEI